MNAFLKKRAHFFFQFVRYGISGVFVYLVDIGFYSLFCVVFPNEYQLGNFLARVIGAFVGFFLHKKYTFGDVRQCNNYRKQFKQYLFLFVGNVLLSAGFLYIAIDIFFINVIVSRIIIDLVLIVFSFFISRGVIFKGSLG